MRRDQIAILRSLAARKATFLLALIWIGSPVIGLGPMRAARFPDLQNSKPSDFHPLAFFQVLGNHADEACQHLLTLLLGELVLLRQRISQMLGGDLLELRPFDCRQPP